MDRVKYVARWIAMVPCALAALLLAPSIVGAIFWITTLVGPVAFDLESFLDRLFFEAVSDGAGGAAFIFVGARIAPEPTARGGDLAPRRVMRTYNQLYPAADHDLATEERDKRLLGTMTFHPCRAALTASRAGRSEARFGCWPSALPGARGRHRRRLRSSQSLRSPAHAHETGGRPTRVLREPRERGSGHAPRAQNG